MQETVSPVRAVRGVVTLPGDKSISHRYAMLASLAEGRSIIDNYSTGADCQSTLACMQRLGVRLEWLAGRRLAIEGGPLSAPAGELDAGNSGSTIRMLSGILAGQRFDSRIGGDASLSRRPMRRIIEPLERMGACIEARQGQFPPLEIHGRPLHGIEYTPPVASAQVKSCILMAGLFAEGDTVVHEPIRTRDHTEIALREMGADLEIAHRTIRLRAGARLKARELVVPGDLSSACFFIVAALMAPEGDLIIHKVGLNPTRTALLDFLAGMGARIKVVNVQQIGGELIGDLRVQSSPLAGGVIEGALTAALIDEIPALAVLGAASEGGLTVRDAAELRVKETDRIATIEAGLRRMGVRIETSADGFVVPGGQRFRAAQIDSAGDHRIAMAFSVAALRADGPSTILEAGAAAVSFPEFFDTLRQIAQQ